MDGNGVRADVDGIRVLAELSRRQATHVEHVESYLHDTCRASGAFEGLMTFFQGTYSGVLSAATQGLSSTRRTHEFAAEKFDECAAEYESADRRSYDLMARLASGARWEISPYRAVGGGDVSLGLGQCVTAPANGDPKEAAADSSIGEDIDAQVEEELKGIPERLTRDTVIVDERRVFMDDLPKGVDPDVDLIGKADGLLDKVNDPFGLGERIGKAKKEYVTARLEDFHRNAGSAGEWTQQGSYMLDQAPNAVGAGSIRHDAGHSYVQNAELHHNVREVYGWYEGVPEAKEYVEGLMDDPTGGVSKSVDELKGAWNDAKELRQVGRGESDTSALDWSDR